LVNCGATSDDGTLRSVPPGQIGAWLRAKQIEIIDVPFQETMALGCNVVAPGQDRVLLPAGSKTLKEALLARGFTIYDPELSMITQGGGVHCMCRSLVRDPV
jgi:N-dimethylarginine dimethylaminohydrolase